MGAIAAGFVTAIAGNSASLSLRADGTGYVKMMSAPERLITWKADGDRVLIYGIAANNSETGVSPSPDPATQHDNNVVIARLSDDKKTLVVDAGPVQFTLTKQAAK